MSTIENYSRRRARQPQKGTAENPYTVEEYETMLDAGTWTGGFVLGLGYCGTETIIQGSSESNSSEDSSSEYNPDDDKPLIDPDDNDDSTVTDEDRDKNGNTGGDAGGTGGGSGGTGGGTGGTTTGETSSYNVNDAVNYLVAHAYPSYDPETCGHCARAVRLAIEAGGISTIGHPTSACDYVSFLPSIGFHIVSKENYQEQKGDIIVISAIGTHIHGHIAMFSGEDWISDFIQTDMWGGSAFRNKAEYTLFRK